MTVVEMTVLVGGAGRSDAGVAAELVAALVHAGDAVVPA